MHISKGLKITLKTLLGVDEKTLAEIEKIDVAELQTQLFATINDVHRRIPEMMQRQERIERALVSILQKLDEVHGDVRSGQDMLPLELDVTAGDWEGKEEVEQLLLLETTSGN